DYADMKAQSRSFAGLASSSDAVYSLTDDGDPEMVIGYRFSPEMFPLLGIRPELGRVFEPADGDHVTVLSDRLWRRRFHADPNIIGRSIPLAEGERHVVIGVMPPEFQHPQSVELWTPLVVSEKASVRRSQSFLRVVGRLKPGVSIEEARSEVRGIAAS